MSGSAFQRGPTREHEPPRASGGVIYEAAQALWRGRGGGGAFGVRAPSGKPARPGRKGTTSPTSPLREPRGVDRVAQRS